MAALAASRGRLFIYAAFLNDFPCHREEGEWHVEEMLPKKSFEIQ